MRRCVVCKKEIDTFIPIERKYVDATPKYGSSYDVKPELLNREEYSCPHCYSSDRDRMIVMFIELLHGDVDYAIDFLEIAPSGALQRYLYKYWGKANLYTADLYMDESDYKVDIQNMCALKNDRFDFVVCSHVLEHVQDDMLAIRELNRVLAYDGLGIIIVPIDLNRELTDEAWGLSEEENIRRFGQKDHVRCYAKKDFILRLKEGGFGVWELNKNFFSAKSFEENALLNTSTLYLVYKDQERYSNIDKVIDKFQESHQYEENEKYIIPSGECNYWIDVCEVYEGSLRIWGWLYIYGVNSQISKLKVELREEKRQYVFGVNFRKRTDIQKKFGGGDEHNNYLFSGVEFLLPTNEIKRGTYRVNLLISNEEKKYMIEVKTNICLG